MRTLSLGLLFGLASFLGAALLFILEPMAAKGLLPTLGGSPGVWNTCVLFFQLALLAGYALAHAIAMALPKRAGLILFIVGYSGILALLPFDVTKSLMSGNIAESHPTIWILASLAMIVGLPFLMVATTAPTLQDWFASTSDRASRDPYILYASSNAGGLLALLAYPIIVEPSLTLVEQGELWAWGYQIFAVLMIVCAMVAWRTSGNRMLIHGSIQDSSKPSRAQVCHWIALAFLPSSLMLGVTTYLSTDIAAIPLLWIIPLALYQVSFIVVFSRYATRFERACLWGLPAVISILAISLGFGLVQAWWIPLHLLGFFMVAVCCHGQLARDRPSPRFLTSFYLSLCVGGVFGGLFNTLVAPLVFDRIVEYPLVLVLSLFTLPGGRPRTWRDLILPGGIIISLAVAVTDVGRLGDSLLSVIASMLAIGLIAFVLWTKKNAPARYALTVGAALAASGLSDGVNGRLLYRERSFFGTLRITNSDDGQFRRFFHGSTLHGIQSLNAPTRDEPLAYFTRSGPFGQIYDAFDRGQAPREVGIVGLGAGAMACYAKPDQSWTFFELDPSVARVATNPRWFTFLSDCRAKQWRVVLGDARLQLRDTPDHSFGLIVLDAFSSDAVPVHLLTSEALSLYRSKLADHGLIAFQITNRYLTLEPIIGALAVDAGWICVVNYDTTETRDDVKQGRQGSIWALLTADEADLGTVANDARWRPARSADHPWTDHFSYMLDVLPGHR